MKDRYSKTIVSNQSLYSMLLDKFPDSCSDEQMNGRYYQTSVFISRSDYGCHVLLSSLSRKSYLRRQWHRAFIYTAVIAPAGNFHPATPELCSTLIRADDLAVEGWPAVNPPCQFGVTGGSICRVCDLIDALSSSATSTVSSAKLIHGENWWCVHRV